MVKDTSRTFVWQYDPLYRLTNEVVSGGTSGSLGYAYDSVGNPRHPHIVNHGIDPTHIVRGDGRPIETVKIEDVRGPAPDRKYERLDPGTRTLQVYRPRFDSRRDR